MNQSPYTLGMDTYAYELHLFGRISAAQDATKIGINIYSYLTQSVSLSYLRTKN